MECAMKSSAWVVVLVACTSNPPPPAVTPGPAQPAPPVERVEPLPIDPAKPMPAHWLGTGATLQLDQAATVTIDGRSDVYSAGMQAADQGRGGMLPSRLTLAAGGGVLTFPKVHGLSGCRGDANVGPDGGGCGGGNTKLLAAGGISGIEHRGRSLFLVGVFLGAAPPAKTPAALDFSPGALGDSFPELAPQVGQIFFIGDGRTGTGSGDLQRFVIPAGATDLYLGYADGYGFQGTPGWYGDNTGGLSVSVTQRAQ
jgi:hypothetical protein